MLPISPHSADSLFLVPMVAVQKDLFHVLYTLGTGSTGQCKELRPGRVSFPKSEIFIMKMSIWPGVQGTLRRPGGVEGGTLRIPVEPKLPSLSASSIYLLHS